MKPLDCPQLVRFVASYYWQKEIWVRFFFFFFFFVVVVVVVVPKKI